MSTQLPEVLIVDSTTTVRVSIARILGDDYKIHTASDGEEAWQILSDNPDISLVFADMHMPKLNGMLFLQLVRASNLESIASVPVVMLTTDEDTRAVKRAAHTLGASDFLSKPPDRDSVLKIADDFTKLNRRIAEYKADSELNNLIGLDNHRALINFGNKTVAFSHEHGKEASILYAEIAGIAKLTEAHGVRLAEQLVSAVEKILGSSLRKSEFFTRIDNGKFAVVLPMTKVFSAHIVASRLRKLVNNIKFDIGGTTVKVQLAVGITVTEVCEEAHILTFNDYCIQAALALMMSLETPNHPVVRYDETFENLFEDFPEELEITTSGAATEQDSASLEEFGEVFTSILTGDYSMIPESYAPCLVEPLESFLKYARTMHGDVVQIGSRRRPESNAPEESTAEAESGASTAQMTR